MPLLSVIRSYCSPFWSSRWSHTCLQVPKRVWPEHHSISWSATISLIIGNAVCLSQRQHIHSWVGACQLDDFMRSCRPNLSVNLHCIPTHHILISGTAVFQQYDSMPLDIRLCRVGVDAELQNGQWIEAAEAWTSHNTQPVATKTGQSYHHPKALGWFVLIC